MSSDDLCLTDSELRELLNDPPSPEVPEEWETHLGNCDKCQNRLQQFAGYSPTIRPQDTQLPIPTTWNLGQVMNELRDEEQPSFDQDALSTLRKIAEPSDDDADVIGRIGRYVLHSPLGQGGMGVVAKAWDPDLDRFIAIKFLLPELASKQSARERFIREAKAAAVVRHPNVVTVHAVETGEIPFFVMEYVQGPTLQQILSSNTKPTLEQILKWTHDITQGLAAAHRRELIHRDIKPANVLIDDETNSAKLTDFGLVKALSDNSGLTASGTIAGTPEFMSPEQVDSNATIDRRSDLFSLGAVLYFALTGSSPFRTDSVLSTIRKVSDDHPPAISSIAPDVPRWLQDVVQRLLKKSPNDRFQTADEVAEAISNESSKEVPTRRFALAAAVAIAIIALVVTAVVLMDSEPTASATGHFVVDGKPDEHTTLAAAVDAAAEGDVILVSGDGEYLTAGLQLSEKPLTIRAAPNSAPTLTLLSQETVPLIATNSDLVLQGIRFRSHGNESTTSTIRSIVACQGGSLTVSNCEFDLRGRGAAISSTADCVIDRSRFIATDGVGLYHFPASSATVSIGNCIFEGVHGVGLAATEKDASASVLKLQNNTFRTYAAVQVMGSFIIKDAVRVFATQNDFQTTTVCGRHITGRRYPAMRIMLRSMKSLISWREDRFNRLKEGSYYLLFYRKSGQIIDGLKNRDDWLACWKLTDADDTTEAEPALEVGANESLVGIGGPFHLLTRQD